MTIRILVVLLACTASYGESPSTRPADATAEADVRKLMDEAQWDGGLHLATEWRYQRGADHQVRLLEALARRLEHTRALPTQLSGATFVPSRGIWDKNFPGVPYIAVGDIFIEGGKAAEAIRYILGEPNGFPPITADLPKPILAERAKAIRLLVQAYAAGVNAAGEGGATAGRRPRPGP